MSKRKEKDLKDFNYSLDEVGNLNLSYVDLRDGNRNLKYKLAVILPDGIRFGAHFFHWDEWNKVISDVKRGKAKLSEIKEYKDAVTISMKTLNEKVEGL
jgi:hypothetical protein